MALFYCPCKALLWRSAGLCWSALWQSMFETWTGFRWSVHGLKISICPRRHQTSPLTAFYRVVVYLYHLRVKSRLAWNLTVSRLCCGVVWYCGKIARLDVWCWYWWLWAGSLGLWIDWAGGLVDRLKGLWISKGKTRVRVFYQKKIIPKRTSVLCPWPAIFHTIFYHFQIKKWKLFSSKKIG